MSNNLNELYEQPWYHGLLPREDMKEMLKKQGDFLVRMAEPHEGDSRKFVLSVMVDEDRKEMKHVVVKQKEDKYYLTDGTDFESLFSLITHYSETGEKLTPACPIKIKKAIEKQPWQKSHKDVILARKLGAGAFGEVRSGMMIENGTQIPVAVKLAKMANLKKENIRDMMREARLMRKLDHPNIVKFYGVAANQEPLMVIMELADHGSVDSFLKRHTKPQISINKKIEMTYQVSKGLAYLHDNNIIHRDIALRNCLLGNGQVKISDFGLSREGTSYVLGKHRKVPIRWLAPEIISKQMYTTASDVWAYGILCWEVFKNGEEPYRGWSTAEVQAKVKSGYRMNFPHNCPPEYSLYVARSIWADSDTARPKSKDVVIQMAKFHAMYKSSSPIGSPKENTPTIMSDAPSKDNNQGKSLYEHAFKMDGSSYERAFEKIDDIDRKKKKNKIKLVSLDNDQYIRKKKPTNELNSKRKIRKRDATDKENERDSDRTSDRKRRERGLDDKKERESERRSDRKKNDQKPGEKKEEKKEKDSERRSSRKKYRRDKEVPKSIRQ